MAENQNLNAFRNDDGSTGYEGQKKAGEWEAKNYSVPSPQQPGESSEAYGQRISAFNQSKNQ